MIDVSVRYENDRPVRLTVSGHAESGPYGADIVCAAVSALVETLGLGLQTVAGIDRGVDIRPGFSDFCFPRDMDAPTLAVVATILTGLKDISQSHGAYVQWNEDRKS